MGPSDYRPQESLRPDQHSSTPIPAYSQSLMPLEAGGQFVTPRQDEHPVMGEAGRITALASVGLAHLTGLPPDPTPHRSPTPLTPRPPIENSRASPATELRDTTPRPANRLGRIPRVSYSDDEEVSNDELSPFPRPQGTQEPRRVSVVAAGPTSQSRYDSFP